MERDACGKKKQGEGMGGDEKRTETREEGPPCCQCMLPSPSFVRYPIQGITPVLPTPEGLSNPWVVWSLQPLGCSPSQPPARKCSLDRSIKAPLASEVGYVLWEKHPHGGEGDVGKRRETTVSSQTHSPWVNRRWRESPGSRWNERRLRGRTKCLP